VRGIPGALVLGVAFWLAVAGSWWSSARLAGAAAVLAFVGIALLYIAKPIYPIR